MVKKRELKLAKTLKKFLGKQIDLPIKLPNTKLGNFLGKNRPIPLSKYFANSWNELKRVTWPSRSESIKLTIAVIVFSLFFTVVTALADAGFAWLVERIIL